MASSIAQFLEGTDVAYAIVSRFSVYHFHAV